VKVLVIPVAALTRPPWTPAVKASLDQPKPCSASHVMALMALEAVGGAPSIAMLGKGRIQGDLGSCLGKTHGAVPMSFSPATPSYPFTPPLPGLSPCGAAPMPRLPLAPANGRRGAEGCGHNAVASYL